MTRYQRAYQTMEVAQETLIKLMSEGTIYTLMIIFDMALYYCWA